MLTAQRVGVPMEETAAPGSAAAVTGGDDMAVLRSSNESEVSFTAVTGAAPGATWTLVLAGAARWEVLFVENDTRTRSRGGRGLSAVSGQGRLGATRGVQWSLQGERTSSVGPSSLQLHTQLQEDRHVHVWETAATC